MQELSILIRRPMLWAEKNVTHYRLFRKSRLRWLWCCLFLISRRRIKSGVFLVVMAFLLRHLYYVGIYKPQPVYRAEAAQVCGHSMAAQASERLRFWKEACNTGRLREADENEILNNFYSDNGKKFLFCSVPRVSDTFWKRIIRYVNNASGTMTGSFFSIPKWKTFYLGQSEIHETPQSSVRFLFGQDPYIRLYHTWLEKFFLTGYWLKDFTKQEMQQSNKERPTCHPDMSFPDFLSMVTLPEHLEHPAHLDVHWRPQVYICDICWLQPAYVGQMETFEKDAQCVLSMTNLTWILSMDPSRVTLGSTKVRISPLTQRQVYKDHMRILTLENFARWHTNPVIRECISLQDLVQRLWRTFQYKGYLPAHVNISEALRSKKEIKPEDFLQECNSAYFSWRGSTIRARVSRRQAAQRNITAYAYEAVPTNTLELVGQLYSSDFATLGYPARPAYLFASRYVQW